MESPALSVPSRADSPVKEEAGGESFAEPFERANNTFAHPEGPESPVSDVGGDGVEAFFGITPSAANLRLLGSFRREVSVFDFERKRAEDFGAVPARNTADE